MSGVGFFDVGTACPDLVIENGQLKFDLGLETSVLISFFTDKRASLEQLPIGHSTRRGWWADLIAQPSDDQYGSLAWTFEKTKLNAATAASFSDALQTSLQWMIDDGIADTVVVSSEVIAGEQITLSVEITKPSGDNIPFKFIWDGQALKIEGA